MALTQASEGGLKISNAGTNGQFLQKQSGNTGGLTWATVTAGGGGGSGTDYDDNVKVRFGTGNDLQLYHDGTRSYINNTTGALYLESGSTEIGLIKGTYASGEWMLRAINDGAVELFHDNTKKLETIANGTNIVGNLGVNRSGANKTIDIETASNANAFYLNSIGTPSNYYGRIADDGTTFLEIDASKNIKLISDSAKVQIGADQDLEIYHDGSHSVIKESGTGDLRIQTASFRLRNEDASEMMISADADGAVYLAHNGVTKLETAAGGVTVTGNIETNEHISLTGDNKKLKFGAGEDLVIYHDGSNSYIQDDGTGELRIRGTTIRLTDNDGSENFANFVDDGAVELFFNNVAKFATYADGVEIRGDFWINNQTNAGKDIWFDESADLMRWQDSVKATFGTSDDLQIFHDGTNTQLNNNTGILKFGSAAGGIELNTVDGHAGIKIINDAAVELYHNNTKQCETAADGLAFPSGKGVNFNATADASGTGVTAGSELLDDYEEGTWTPYIYGHTSAGTGTYPGTSTWGKYTKVGNIVNCIFALYSSAHTGSGGTYLAGMPFTSISANSHFDVPIGGESLNCGADKTMKGHLHQGDVKCRVMAVDYESGGDAGFLSIEDGNMYISGSFTYLAA